MKITIATKELSRVLGLAASIIQPKVAIPVLQNVRIDVVGTKATISASDLGQNVVAVLSIVASDGDGSILVLAKKLQEILNAVTAENITLETADTKLLVKAGKFKATFRNESPSAFPVIPTAPAPKYIINLPALKTLIEKVEASVPAKEGRYSQPVIQLERTGNVLRAVATDGFRIAIADATVEAGQGDFTLLLQKPILPVIKEMTGDTVAFGETDNHFFFLIAAETALSNKPSAKFPAYQNALKGVFKTNAVVNADELRSAINRALALVDAKNPAVILSVGADMPNMSVSTGSDDGETADSIDVKVEGIANSARLNPSFVLDFLSHSTGAVTVEFISEKALVRFSNGAQYQYFVMPMLNPEDQPAEGKKKG